MTVASTDGLQLVGSTIEEHGTSEVLSLAGVNALTIVKKSANYT